MAWVNTTTILYYKSFKIPERPCLFPTLSLHPVLNSFSISSLFFSQPLLPPTALSWLSAVCLCCFTVWSCSGHYPSKARESQQRRVADIPWFSRETPTYAEVWSLPHFLRQLYQAVDSHSACDIPTPHALSQHWYLLRYPSSAFIHLFSPPHRRPSHLHFLNSYLTHFNHFCILSRSIWTPNPPSTMPQTTGAYSPCPLYSPVHQPTH